MKKVFLILFLIIFAVCLAISAASVTSAPPAGLKELHDFLGVPATAKGYGKTYGHETMLAIAAKYENVDKRPQLIALLVGTGREPTQAIKKAQDYARQAALVRTTTFSVISIRVASLAVVLGMMAIIMAIVCFYVLLGFFYPLVNRYEVIHRPGPAYAIGIVLSIFLIGVLLTGSLKVYGALFVSLVLVTTLLVFIRREHFPEGPQRINPFS